jgi:hypothetical protein
MTNPYDTQELDERTLRPMDDDDEAITTAEVVPQDDAPRARPTTQSAAPTVPTNERWQEIQSAFVDNPRSAVGQAHQLVGEAVQRIVDRFTHERDELEGQWSKGGDVSTEDLRLCLQHYREFFSRLAPLEEQRGDTH